MVNFSELFNVNATTLPMDKKSLSSMMNRATLVGYYQCAYSSLISTLKMIQSAPELSVSLNPQWLWNNANNPTNKLECIIQIEGMQTYSEFVDKVVKNDDAKEWTDFLTYSPEFRDEILATHEWPFSFLSGVFFQPHRKRFGISGFHFLLTAFRCLALGYKILFAQNFQRLFTQQITVCFCKRFACSANTSINHRP